MGTVSFWGENMPQTIALYTVGEFCDIRVLECCKRKELRDPDDPVCISRRVCWSSCERGPPCGPPRLGNAWLGRRASPSPPAARGPFCAAPGLRRGSCAFLASGGRPHDECLAGCAGERCGAVTLHRCPQEPPEAGWVFRGCFLIGADCVFPPLTFATP